MKYLILKTCTSEQGESYGHLKSVAGTLQRKFLFYGL